MGFSKNEVGVLYKCPKSLVEFINKKTEEAIYFDLRQSSHILTVVDSVYNPFLKGGILWEVTYRFLNVTDPDSVWDWGGRQFDQIYCLGGTYESDTMNYAFSRVRSRKDYTHGT